MKQLKTILSACLLVFCLLVISSFTNSPSYSKVAKLNTGYAVFGNPHVNGGGSTPEGNEKSTFVFNAVQHNDGSVVGHLNYMFRASGIDIQMDLDCLDINGNRATLSGVVTHVFGDGPVPGFIFVGQRASFTVQDNGQGKGASPDLISDLILYGGASCANNWFTYLPISGNIDIKE